MDDIQTVFSELFPIASDEFSLEFVGETVVEDTGEIVGGLRQNSDGSFLATLRTISWEVVDGERSIRDVREQQVVVVLAGNAADPRLPAYFAGWAAALRFILARHQEMRADGTLPAKASDSLECAMPHELVCPDVLRLGRPQTADEFTDALLSSKKRLAKFMP